MSYLILIPKTVQKQIDKLSDDIRASIIESLLILKENPRSFNSLKMKDSQGYRMRTGDYRILYDIDDKSQSITLRRVGHRRDIYRG